MATSEVTFRDFQKLMLKRKRTVDDLVHIFRGKLDLSGNSARGANDNSRSFFERVMSCKWYNAETGRYEDRGDVVIPYSIVIAFYHEEQHFLEASQNHPYDPAPPGKPACTLGS